MKPILEIKTKLGTVEVFSDYIIFYFKNQEFGPTKYDWDELSNMIDVIENGG